LYFACEKAQSLVPVCHAHLVLPGVVSSVM